MLAMKHVRIHITGIVQGVGMRPFVYREAVTYGITGWVLNAGDGVHIEAHGEAAAVDAFARALREEAPAAASVTGVAVTPLVESTFDTENPTGFRIIASEDDTEHTTLVSPDIATCPDCLRELFDPADRRYHYPFINCTNCGPRFTIIRSLPYDRASTSMNAFPMCPECAREYADPLDRRFHAQPDACFECGPHLTWREKNAAGRVESYEPNTPQTKTAFLHKNTGNNPLFLSKNAASVWGDVAPTAGKTREESDAIIDRCAELLAEGKIVAIKGLGGFHLACDAGNDAAVRELRRRKRRSNKPLAVMVRAIEKAQMLCEVNETERELLTSTVRPIVLLKRRPMVENATFELAPSVAFGLPELGIMLPYTPLQHLLLAACKEHGLGALVMTSGNISEEPIEVDDDLAWKHLVESGIADALLGNNRAILARYDDSVVRVVDGEVQMVRRARGYAPRPLALPKAAEHNGLPTILACGSEQKATIAFTRERTGGSADCFLSQHIGDVENGATFDAWHSARSCFERLFDLHPVTLACDLHPRYLPSQWARERAHATGMPLIEVQHHHAHIASVIAEAAAHGEHDQSEPVIGIAFDGTGAGAQRIDSTDALQPDGTIWGGEFLIVDLTGFTRAAHLKPWRLPGGAASVRDPRRNAFALLSAYGLLDHPGANQLLASLTDEERSITATMIERGLNSPFTSSMGRFLDAIAAILGICGHATYEGEPAILLEAAANRSFSPNPVVYSEKVAENARFANSNSPHSNNYGEQTSEKHPHSAQQALFSQNEMENEPNKPSSLYDELRKSGNFCQISSKNSQNPTVINPAELLSRLLDGMAMGETPDSLARYAHQAVAAMTIDTTCDIAMQTSIRTVALSGGVFMNRLLLSGIRHGLEERGLKVLIPRDIPVNDGCISYGQAAIARATISNQ